MTAGRRRGLMGFALLWAAATACGAPRAGSGPAPDYCERNVTYWSQRLVSSRADSALDYQEMGLSDAEYDLVRAVVLGHPHGAEGTHLSPGDVGRIKALCQAHRATSVTSPTDRGRTWPTG